MQLRGCSAVEVQIQRSNLFVVVRNENGRVSIFKLTLHETGFGVQFQTQY